MENRILENYLRTGKMRNLKGEKYEREEGVCYCVYLETRSFQETEWTFYYMA